MLTLFLIYFNFFNYIYFSNCLFYIVHIHYPIINYTQYIEDLDIYTALLI